MNRNTFDTIKDFLDVVGGKMQITVHRADGSIEGPVTIGNQVTALGLNDLAVRSTVTSYAPFVNIAVGSGTDVSSLGSTVLIHEVSRKASTVTTSFSTMILTNTWGGFADSVTSVALEEAGIFDAVSSGTGIMLNRVTGVAATLADSDIVNLEMLFQIGSHAVP